MGHIIGTESFLQLLASGGGRYRRIDRVRAGLGFWAVEDGGGHDGAVLGEAKGGNLGSRCFWEPVAKCDRFSASTSESGEAEHKSLGNRSALRFTCSLSRLVVTPYSAASSASSSTR